MEREKRHGKRDTPQKKKKKEFACPQSYNNVNYNLLNHKSLDICLGISPFSPVLDILFPFALFIFY